MARLDFIWDSGASIGCTSIRVQQIRRGQENSRQERYMSSPGTGCILSLDCLRNPDVLTKMLRTFDHPRLMGSWNIGVGALCRKKCTWADHLWRVTSSQMGRDVV